MKNKRREQQKQRSRSRAFYADQLGKANRRRPVRTRKATPDDFEDFDAGAERTRAELLRGKPATAKQRALLKKLGLEDTTDRAEATKRISEAL